MKVRKAVVPVAGLGTRFLPATKAIPKEMLTIVDRPIIQYIVEEIVASGIKEVILVTASGKSAIENHFDYSFELEIFLAQKGKMDLLREVRQISNLIEIVSVRQKEPLGLGHAVKVSEPVICNEPFVVVLGDDMVDAKVPCVFQMLKVFEEFQKSVVAVQKVSLNETHKYGIVEGEKVTEGVYKVQRLIEKPAPGTSKSDLAIIGRYVLTPEIYSCLNRTPPGVGDEIQLTDALDCLRKEQGLYAYEFKGSRYDAGNKMGYLQATMNYALAHPDLGGRFKEYLKKLVADLDD
ncbi:MAG: UTP--glucose-1-phosphate uridylyltransferase GalU [Thermodesulfobacteriota bacterium]|nr:UTP--glucose-1-phosphate uridylyltransferase GalU [Thermodesulfobacteriota bacterium]